MSITMANIASFEKYSKEYDDWFETHRFVYESELRAVAVLLPEKGQGIEIGVGTGRFAGPLGIKLGVDPSAAMREIARQRGIKTTDNIAEDLPFDDAIFDFAVMVTTICFVENVEAAVKEAYRILKPGGKLIIGFIDKESPLGMFYTAHRDKSIFYGPARFYSVGEIISHLSAAGFSNFGFMQTIFRSPSEIKEIEPVKEGCGEGSFVAIRAIKTCLLI